jgi:hypothetical protein
MTQAQTKGQEAAKDQETAKEQTLQQHHEKAAEHHEQAAKHHKEAVKYYESGDTKTAAHHSLLPMDILNKRENKKWKLARNTR